MEVVSHLLFEALQEDHCSVADCCCRKGKAGWRSDQRWDLGMRNADGLHGHVLQIRRWDRGQDAFV